MARLDLELVRRGLAPSRRQAQDLIREGLVHVAGREARRPALDVAPDAVLELIGALHPYVSRGGVKLEAALRHFALDPTGWCCLDVGASTGGFTDCLLQHGAAAVTALDVGRHQLHPRLREDPRIRLLEGVNARELQGVPLQGAFDLAVLDVSFISLTLVLPSVVPRVASGGRLVALVKPQFECGREALDRHGVVRDVARRQEALARVEACLRSLGMRVLGSCESPITGGDGNAEWLVAAQKPLPSA